MYGITLFTLLVVALGVVQPKNLCPLDWAEFKGECLFFAKDGRSWIDAQRDCRSRGAYLASDDNPDKHNFMRQVMSALKTFNIDGFYLGSDDFAFEGTWRWMETGFPVSSFTAWGSGMPQGEDGHNCMKFSWEDNEAVWVDEDCNQRRHYICEKQAIDFRNNTQIIGR
ncbi:perlucin-like protein [Mytilus galloprovincialis]|uniref:perlucin-like protein n=1 Tax=Mytilus galloprovincialis TaxID=29158 RepID=UPI003F7CB4C7